MVFIIKIFSDFCDSTTCKTNFEKTYNLNENENYGMNKEFYITDKLIYTHAIILNKAMPTLIKIPKENVIGLACEPYELLKINKLFIIYAQINIGKYFIGDKKDLPEPFTEHFAYMWHSNPGRSLTHKPKIMSICVSEKNYAPGHKYRHDLITEIINHNLPVHIYGRGANQYKEKSEYVMGEFKDVEPYEEYMFTIAIENYINNDYISEKVLSPVMHNCKPLYLGARNISNYIDKNDVILINRNLSNDIAVIKDVLSNPTKHYNTTYNSKNIDNINLFNKLEKIFTPNK